MIWNVDVLRLIIPKSIVVSKRRWYVLAPTGWSVMRTNVFLLIILGYSAHDQEQIFIYTKEIAHFRYIDISTDMLLHFKVISNTNTFHGV